MKRKALWIEPYHEAIQALYSSPFAWGDDCITKLTGPVILAIAGQDLYSEYLGRYQDEESAIALIRSEGFDDLCEIVASRLPEIHPVDAQIGDIAAIPINSPLKYGLGVFNGERVITLTQRGIGSVDRRLATRAFKVG